MTSPDSLSAVLTTPNTDGPSTSELLNGFIPQQLSLTQLYQSEGIFRNQPLWKILDAGAPDSPAITDADTALSFTYQELQLAVTSRARGFLQAGLKSGNRVILQLNNSADFAITFLSLLRANVIPVLTLPAHRITEIASLAKNSGAIAYISEDDKYGYDYRDLANELARIVPTIATIFINGDPGMYRPLPDSLDTSIHLPTAVNPNEPALFLISGGTTGLPKLIARTHNDYDYNARQAAKVCEVTEADTYLVALPGAHNFPLCCPGFLGMLAVGGHTVFTNNPSPDNAFELIEEYQITITSLVPTLAHLWGAAKEWELADISSLRLLQIGGSKLLPIEARTLDDTFGPVLQQVFGMAEGLICFTRPNDSREDVQQTQGSPMSEFDEIRIINRIETDVSDLTDVTDVTDGTEGELLVRGPYTINGYYRADTYNATAFTRDGFYRSGDLVRRNASGKLTVTGRIKEVIIRAGENISANQVEEVLTTHPAIHQVTALSLPDEMLGEKVCAAVILAPDTTLSLHELREYLAERNTSILLYPDELIALDSFPYTPVGKIDKNQLRTTLIGTTNGPPLSGSIST